MNVAANPIPSLAEIMKLPVYGPAGYFPMLADDELQELADDIKANGQREPIVVGEIADEDGIVTMMLIDGRNRREACRIAGVEPQVRLLGDQDASAFVLSVNVNRRHMTAGQRAAARALLQPDGEKGGRGKTLTNSGEFSRAEANAISQARLVLRFDKPLLYSVLNGAITLNAAYDQAKQIQSKQADEEQKQASERAALDALRKRYPDLARRVEEDGLSLKAMMTEADEKDRQARSQRQSLFMGLRNARVAMTGFAASSELPRLPEYLKSKEIRKEFVAEFREDPSALTKMISVMESELTALKQVVEQISGD